MNSHDQRKGIFSLLEALLEQITLEKDGKIHLRGNRKGSFFPLPELNARATFFSLFFYWREETRVISSSPPPTLSARRELLQTIAPILIFHLRS